LAFLSSDLSVIVELGGICQFAAIHPVIHAGLARIYQIRCDVLFGISQNSANCRRNASTLPGTGPGADFCASAFAHPNFMLRLVQMSYLAALLVVQVRYLAALLVVQVRYLAVLLVVQVRYLAAFVAV
jgi:hypothetical protein